MTNAVVFVLYNFDKLSALVNSNPAPPIQII